MKRMNREKNNPRTDVKKYCANYNTGYVCSGVVICRDLSQYIDSELEGKICPVEKGDECLYFLEIVKPNVD